MPALRSAGIRVAFTTRAGGFSAAPFGGLNLSFVSGDEAGRVRANRARALSAIGAAPEEWTSGRQVHGNEVAYVDAGGAGAFSAETTIAGTDALWTDAPGVTLAVLTADCVPIALADPERRRVGVVHAGWRGLAAGVVGRAVEAMGGARVAAIGPAIGPCCYAVGDDVANVLADAVDPSVVRRGDSTTADLWRAAGLALARANVRHIAFAALCTRSEPFRFYSHRAGDAGRQGVLIRMAGR